MRRERLSARGYAGDRAVGPRQPGRHSSTSNHDACAVEPSQRELFHTFIQALTLLRQYSDSDFLAKTQSGFSVGPPMDAGGIAPERDIRRQLVELSADGEGCASIWFQRQTVLSGDDGLFDWKRLVEECLQHRGARAGDRSVAGRVRRMERCALGVGLRQEVRLVALKGQLEGDMSRAMNLTSTSSGSTPAMGQPANNSPTASTGLMGSFGRPTAKRSWWRRHRVSGRSPRPAVAVPRC
jgi:hypothetical protein